MEHSTKYMLKGNKNITLRKYDMINEIIESPVHIYLFRSKFKSVQIWNNVNLQDGLESLDSNYN